ncbi:MAG: hypothetical protein IV100_23475 [Myxococcales bacterium]|nr:hypothetical protein [Myxococcales bacterium]
MLIQNRPLRDWQADLVRDGGFELTSDRRTPCLVVPDTLFATGDLMRRFVLGAAGRNAVLVLKESAFGRNTTAVQPGVVRVPEGWRFEAIRYDAGDDAPPVDVVVDPLEQVQQLPVPAAYTGSETIELAMPRDPVMTIHHWVHILWATQAAGAIELRRIPLWKAIVIGLWAFLRCLSVNKWKLLGKLNRVGRRCDIHPTAVIEGSTLGDGVTVGPYARVLFSRVGDGATIMAGAQVEATTLGERSVVCQQTVLRGCVLYPEAIGGQQVMQMCVLGRGVVTTLASYAIDLDFEKPIRVPLDGQMVSTGQRFLGSAFGHGVRVGTGTWMSHGRMIPNGYFVVRDPSDVIQKIPGDLPAGEPLSNHSGRLAPVGRPTQTTASSSSTERAEPPPIG